MTLAQLKDRIKTLRADIRKRAEALAAMAMQDGADMTALETERVALAAMNQQLSALTTSYAAQEEAEGDGVPADPTPDAMGKPSLRDRLKSREYARAFAYAVRNGINPTKRYDDKCKVLYDALTEAGGTPAGSDGGFLVPEDIDHNIRELRRTLDPLADLFTVETTSTNKGWRVQDIAPTKGMTKLDSEIPSSGIPQDDQPMFVKVPFALDTYGLILPVSNELASDEVAGLFNYLARWFARKQIITENGLLKAILEALTPSTITADDPLDQIKRVLNVALDPAISVNATLLSNQDGFDYLDNLKDTTGRPMLQPDPTNATLMRFKGRPVKMVSNALLATASDAAPLYIGDFKQLATLFMRQGLEVRSTDIGGNAFHTNSIEVRGITRLGAAKFDTASAVRCAIDLE